MSERETADVITDRAAEWVVRVDRAGRDPEVQEALEAWLASDARHRGAYFRAQATWAMLNRSSALRNGDIVPGHEELGEQAEDNEADRFAVISRRRLVWSGGAIAAALVAAVTFYNFEAHSPEVPVKVTNIATAIGEIRRVPLEDGSLATVNTKTSLAVDLRPQIRRVELREGEAWFQVAKDKSRPFVVQAERVRVTAVGTAFSVRKTAASTEVLVTEGVVQITGLIGPSQLVSAGSRAAIDPSTGALAVTDGGPEIERALAWRNGQLLFDGDTLGAAVSELNRYNVLQVRIMDPGLAQERLVGRFRTNEPQAFASAAATILGAHARIADGEIRLSRR